MGMDSLLYETMHSTLFAVALQLSSVTAVFSSIQLLPRNDFIRSVKEIR